MRNQKVLKLVQLAMLIAIMLVLYFTGLSFLMIPPVSITTLVIPVIVGAIIIGPSGGAVLGGVFGLLSMWMASTAATSPVDMAFSPFLSGSPVSSLIMCIGTRVLFGWLAGMLFKGLFTLFKKHASSRIGTAVSRNLAVVVSSVVGVFVHTASVMLCLWLLFPALGTEFKAVVSAIASLNVLAEVLMATVFAVAFANVMPLINRKFKN
jgi:uncharacterized membrane protein